MIDSHKNAHVTNLCPICGTGFHPRKGRELTNKYCSRSCMGVAERRQNYVTPHPPREKIVVNARPCNVCGIMFTPKVDKRDTAKYCSQACLYSDRKKAPPTRGELVSSLMRRCNKTESCWLWTGAKVRGYGSINVRGRGAVIVPRLSYELFIAAIPPGMFVCHTCDTPACLNPEHLFIGTPADNVHDMVVKGRRCAPELPKGEAHHATSLTEDDVMAIRKSCSARKDIAARYGVSVSTIRNILTGRTWAHVGLPSA